MNSHCICYTGLMTGTGSQVLLCDGVFFSLFITHFCNSDTLRFFQRHTATAFKNFYDELMISPETVPISWVCEGAHLCLSHSRTLVNCKVKSPKPHPVSICLMRPLLLFFPPADIQKNDNASFQLSVIST